MDKEHLYYFTNMSEYEAFKNGEYYVTPNVCFIEEDENIIYNEKEIIIKNYLRFTSLEDSTISLTNNSSNTPNVEYSFDGINDWTTWDYSAISLPSGTTVYMKGNNPNGFSKSSSKYSTFNMTGKIESHGNIMSLLYDDDFEDKLTIPSSYCYYRMFQGCKSLTTSPELPATTLTPYCYRDMFNDCTSLTTAPELPATTLTEYCYYGMFNGCSSLATAPELPSTTLASSCYYGMFDGCTSLTTAPELPATTLADSCYSSMFNGCSSLTTAPELPATTLATYCYYGMFDGCTKLTTAPELPATTLANSCYYYMFRGCTSLTTAPELPSTTLAEGCYQLMFYGCSSLNNITMLATNISASYCLGNWVSGVASTGTFTKSPSMTSLQNGVNGIPEGWTVQNYYYFPSISNILSTPIDFNYNEGMFTPTVTVELTKIMSEENILSLQPMCDITVNVINKDNSLHTSDYLWVNAKTLSDVMQELNISNINDIAIVIVDAEIPEDSGYYYYNVENSIPISFSNSIQCSINGSDWKLLNGNTLTSEETEPFVDANYFTIETEEGDIFKFKGNLTPVNSEGIGTFNISKKCNVKGNIMSLLYGDNFEGQNDLTGKNYAFYQLFYDCHNIIDTSELILPATTLANYCYEYMFQGCTSLTTAPELPATTLADCCYSYMFRGCTKLTTSPELPATTLAEYCYSSMFSGCSSLTTAPELPATTLADCCYSEMFLGCTFLTTAPELPATTLAEYCYSGMFYGCKALTTAPELPATTLALYCYQSMFDGCISLVTAPELPATTLANYCYSRMFQGCTSLTTAHELPATTLANDCYAYMFRGCTSLTTAPELPSTTLANYCYREMFNGCKSLNSITMLATDISASNCLSNWVSGVATNGTFTKLPSMTSLPSGNNGIPNRWIVQNYNG